MEENPPQGAEAALQENTIRFPSGDHEGCLHDQFGSFVTRRW